MDEPARKRRRTNSPNDRASSPLRQPPRRPSFASPTKASLARNYPSLVPTRPDDTRRSPSRPGSRGNSLAKGLQVGTNVVATGSEVGAGEGETISNTPKGLPRSENVTPPTRRSLRPTRIENVAEEDEQDLPTTPSQRGLEEQDGPRRGVLFSSPSKRPPQTKASTKQSPLKNKAGPAQQIYKQRRTREEVDDQVLEPPDPELEKRKHEKQKLKRELVALEAQVTRCAEEISAEQKRQPRETMRSLEHANLNKLLIEICGVEDKAEPPPPISSLLCSFLPFSTFAISKPQSSKHSKPVPSHNPIELADPLPYLQMFTSFTFSTHLSLARSKVLANASRVHQKHVIDISGPQKLLTAQISIIVDANSSQIIAMQVLQLSAWAEQDLGIYLRTKAQEKDLSNACWAIESYWTIASKRAQYWHRCETNFSHLLAGQSSEDTENARPQGQQDSKMSRRTLNRHLGRETLVLQDKHVLLKLIWRIDFDWTGEAESQVSLEPAFPSVWGQGEAAKSLRKVPETFSTLLQGRGVFEATRIMTMLLFAR